ncbi:TRAP transporter large permease [Arthrobacter gengyunqii]|uniref:TRAP transporter large permease n=1 Tax=Arthrobacter gengyunqii TaxID=2886940 RepID=A0ABS8GHU3_9MICC|nr:TRAP transporter large permease [Arthrobacter gengyunqii]MCC3265948.1 TRAP transporter large permease [Arthrobacter gengyunqii]
MLELVLFGSFLLLLFLGVPVAFSMGISSVVTILYMQGVKALFPASGIMYASMASETLLAIPFFILAGVIMELTGISARLIELADACFGHRKSGIALTTILAALVFSSISGSGPATVAALGGILIPALAKHGYRKRHAAALVASAGEMGIVIPPSIAFIVFAVVASDYERISIGRLFAAGVLPGLCMGLAFYLVARFLPREMEQAKASAKLHAAHALGRKAPQGDTVPEAGGATRSGADIAPRPDAVEAVPEHANPATMTLEDIPHDASIQVRTTRAPGRVIRKALVRAIPGLMMPFIILGGIYGGVFTPTESAAVAAVYALIIGLFVMRDLKLADVYKIFATAGVQAARIMFIIATATLFAYVITKYQIAQTVAEGLLSLTSNTVLLVLLINLVLLVAGMFLDAISAFYLFIPLFVPVLLELGMDMTTIGVFMTVNLALGLVTPPVGIDLFVAAGIAKIPFSEAIKGIWPFFLAGLAVLMLVTFVPALSNFLPDLLGL